MRDKIKKRYLRGKDQWIYIQSVEQQYAFIKYIAFVFICFSVQIILGELISRELCYIVPYVFVFIWCKIHLGIEKGIEELAFHSKGTKVGKRVIFQYVMLFIELLWILIVSASVEYLFENPDDFYLFLAMMLLCTALLEIPRAVYYLVCRHILKKSNYIEAGSKVVIKTGGEEYKLLADEALSIEADTVAVYNIYSSKTLRTFKFSDITFIMNGEEVKYYESHLLS